MSVEINHIFCVSWGAKLRADLKGNVKMGEEMPQVNEMREEDTDRRRRRRMVKRQG